MRRTWTILAALGALLAVAPAAEAATFTVTGTADTPPTQGCEGLVCPSIRAALLSAGITQERDTIVVPAGEYQLTNGQLSITSPVDITGAGARATIVRGASSEFRVLSVAAEVTASASGLTLRDGRALDENGGGLFAGGVVVNRGTLTLDRVRITGGRASSGGGLANLGGTVTLTRALVDGNTATDGGGDAGGILNFNGGTITVRDATLTRNAANAGGGYHSRGDVGMNTATFERVTVAANTALGGGSGGVSHAAGDTLRMRATIVASNTNVSGASNCVGAIASDGANIEDGTECGLTGSGDRQQTNPQLAAGGPSDHGGDTDVLALATGSPAIDTAGACTGTDQRSVVRPQGPACDVGAFEAEVVPVAPETTIDSGPVDVSPRQARFTFSSDDPAATFECMLLPNDAWFACTSPWTSEPLADGAPHTFRVRARIGGVFDETPAERTFVVDAVAPSLTITAGPPELTRETNAVFQFNSSDAAARFECTHVFPDGERSTITCESGWNPYDFVDGVHRFEIAAIDPAGNVTRESRTVTVDTIAPEPVTPEASGATFTFASTEPGTSFECRLEGVNDFAPCTSPASFSLAPGEYTFALRTVDAVGNRSAAITRAFTVAAPQPTATATPEPQPVATPRPTPVPTPQAGETVVARAISGRILVKRPNSSEFAELRGSDGIPVGSEVNAKNGRVRLTIEPGNGRPLQQAVFYAGIFRISQPGATLDLTLSEPLAACKQARTAQAKPKSRKLWGDGKGKFRTRGRYSAATVRGTIWLVQDSCAGTFTRVRQGVVSVRDSARGKTVLVRAGRSYLAKPRRR